MGLLSGSISVTRFNVAVPPEGPDFERIQFWAIDPGSEVRERIGVIPFEIDAPYEVGQGRYAFRVRIDRIRADATAVKERLKELVKTEMDATGRPFVGAKTRKKLRELAEAELCARQAPRTRILECCIDNTILYVASTAKSHLGTVLTLLRQAGVEADFKAPWLDEAIEEPEAIQEEDLEAELPAEEAALEPCPAESPECGDGTHLEENLEETLEMIPPPPAASPAPPPPTAPDSLPIG